jgi:acyl transferase domain-containing protein/NADPH:quinone reductase-like Zn-dependent oxidoreductase/acyl carrier protein/NADP-dependent 3-hydroxy acid dehydrogenase YdfG
VIDESTAPKQSQMDALTQWLVRELARVVDISEEAVATNEPFSHFGLDSAKAVGLLSRLGEFLGREIPVTLAWKYPTITALANYLCGNPELAVRNFPSHSFSATDWNQPIAVIGMACRFPGAADPLAFWDLLRSGHSAFREITSDRWDISAWYDPDLGKPGKMNARSAGLLEHIAEFDPDFFGISPREAVQMDPQQRLALELAWEALEDAGVRSDLLRGSRTGLFVGVVWHDYETIARKAGAEITMHSGTAQAVSIVANRISYALGLQGPSIALDTACSSSLVSVHLACRSLQAGEATLALAGGVNMIIDPNSMVTLSKFGGLSPTDQLCAFDARANGFVRGEGGGFVVLKSLNRALADGDPIYAVIRGTAVNNDGASNGLTAPNPVAQERVLREACARSGFQTSDFQYVEAHGTGTPLGDPIEAQALGEVFGRDRPLNEPLLVGSVKTNIGHLEGASGIAGLIKLILSVYHRQIPASLNFETPNPHIDFAASNLRVVTKLEPWPGSRKLAVGGVSAFGWGGTNCHVVVEEADGSTAHLLPLSAPDSNILKDTVEKLRTYLNSISPQPALRDVCGTAATRCGAELERVAVTARSVSELKIQLEGFLLGQKRPGVAVGRMKPTRPKLAFVFSPQGSQWLGMGQNLIAVEPVFRAKLAECDRALTKIAGWSLFDELLAAPGDSRLNRTEFVQPVLTAMQMALAELWSSWGVRPDFVAAHSLGEWAAACVVGALSVEETMKVVVESSRAQVRAGVGGGMAVVECAEAEVKERIKSWSGEIFVAGYNGPTSTILSGDAARLKYIVTSWKQEGLICSLIDVDVAAHSPSMDAALEDLESSLIDLRPTRTAIPFVSSVNGGYLRGTEMGPEHWARHLRQPVLFTQVIERLARDGCTIFIEISPHPLLIGGIQQTLCATGVEGLALSSCRRGDDERGSLLNSLGALYALGYPVEWPAVTGGHDDLSLPIPAALRRAATPIASAAAAPSLLPLSGHTTEALRHRARSFAHYIRTKPEVAVTDIAYMAAVRRTHLEHRLAVVGTGREELIFALEAFAEDQDSANLVAGQMRSTDKSKVAFICSGQGAQWWGMGRELLASTPIFQREIGRCSDEMKRHADWDLLEELKRDEGNSRLGETEIAQPALFALQVGLAAVWRSWGIEPCALVGHSVGEVAAAYLGGVLSFHDAVKVICHRGRLMQRATGLGKMAAIELPEADVEKLIGSYRDCVSTAAINSPTSTVISGEAAAINEIVAAAASRGIRAKALPVNYAFHSPQMEPFGTEMAKAVSDLTVQAASVPVYSTVTGARAAEKDFDAVYWGRNIRQTVRFAEAVRAMLDAGIANFIELSPHPVLSSMVLQCAAKLPQNVQLMPSLRQGRPERFQMLKSLATLFATGAEIDWRGVYPEGGVRRRIHLPTYPFQRERFWFEPRHDPVDELRANRLPDRTDTHPLLGAPLRSPALKDTVFRSQLSAQDPAYLADHQICGRVILPAAAYVEMALAGAHHLFGEGPHSVESLLLQEALQLDFSTPTSVQVIFHSKDGGSVAFEIFSAPGDDQDADAVWTRHVVGRVAKGAKLETAELETLDLQAVLDRCTELVNPETLYQSLNEQGCEFGPAFRNIGVLRRGRAETLAEITLPESLRSEVTPHRFHPASLDACFQAAAQTLPYEANTTAKGEVLLPVNIERIQLFRDVPPALWSHARLRGTTDPEASAFTVDVKVYDRKGRAFGEIAGLQLKRVKRETLERTLRATQKDWLFEIQWREAPRTEEITPKPTDLLRRPGCWLVLADESGIGESLRARLISAGQRCVLALPGPSFVREGADRFALDPANQADFELLLEETGITAETPLRGVLHLWSLDFPALDAMTDEDLARSQLLGCGSSLHLVQGLISLKTDSPPRVWLVTRGAQAMLDSSPPVHAAMASLWGLGHVIAAEHPELHCTLIDLDAQRKDDDGDILFGEVVRGNFGEDSIAFRTQSRLVPRLAQLPNATAPTQEISEPVQLKVSEPGILENLYWASVERAVPGPYEVEIQVQATGLNFRDVLCTLGMYPGKIGALGAECAGLVTRTGDGVQGIEPGDRVMAVARGGFNTYVTVRADHVTHLPAAVSLAEAASIPVVFLTTFYGLHHLARMKAGDRVLIHAAAGGVGLAAVQLAQRAGAEIFATAGSPEKRSHLQTLGLTHVFDSRSLDFANEIMERTGGHGVDIVLNSLAGEFIEKSVSVLAHGGRFLELGKRGILTKEQFGARRPDCEYYAYDLGEQADGDSSLLPGIFKDLLAAFAKGELRPLPVTTFSNEGIVDAFRFMAQAKHVGKIVVIKPAPVVAAGSLPTKLRLRDDAAYLITGGLGGLGLATARWMAGEGAGNIVLMGRHPPNSETNAVIDELTRGGTRIAIEKCDVSDEAALTASLNRISRSMPPLRGIIHAAGVLDDGVLAQQTWSRFAGVMAPKVRGAWNLHRLTLSSELDFFVLFSSAATLIGSPGQGSYAAANAFMDGLAHHRKAKGLPGLSIDWGVWAQSGMAARMAKKDAARWAERGLLPIQLDQGMAKLGEMLVSTRAQIVAAPIDWSRMFASTISGRPPFLYSEIINSLGTVLHKDGKGGPGADDFLNRLSAEPAGRRFAILKAHVESAASQALGATPGRSLDPRRPLHELGLDSLMSIELCNSLATSLSRSLPSTLLFDHPTVESLTQYLANIILHLDLGDRVPAEGRVASDNKDLEELQEMSESEAESLLLTELDQLKKQRTS